jgi:N-formylglutamate amidohydrolase
MPDALRLFDVDRAVDLLYGVAIDELQAPTVVCPWHRYAADLNRLPSDIDAASVVGSTNPVGSFPRGFHWSITTAGQPLMPGPMAPELHERLVERCSEPFHLALAEFAKVLISRAAAREILHLDLHSMPSLGTSEHRDPGELRKDVVISDRDGMSAKREWVELVVEAYRRQGFSVAVNWPYKGGRLTEYYGRPKSGHHTIQVELNRALYMDETSKALHTDRLTDMQIRLAAGLSTIYETLPQI